jgi:hypothetical protein
VLPNGIELQPQHKSGNGTKGVCGIKLETELWLKMFVGKQTRYNFTQLLSALMAEYERMCPSHSFPDDIFYILYTFEPQNG